MKRIKTGKIELAEDEFNPKKGKFRVNMFVDLDVIDKIRALAAMEHTGYQTWINRKLRELVESNGSNRTSPQHELIEMIDRRIALALGHSTGTSRRPEFAEINFKPGAGEIREASNVVCFVRSTQKGKLR